AERAPRHFASPAVNVGDKGAVVMGARARSALDLTFFTRRRGEVIHFCYPSLEWGSNGIASRLRRSCAGWLAGLALLCSGIRGSFSQRRRPVAKFARSPTMARFARAVRLAGGGAVWGPPGIAPGSSRRRDSAAT